MHNNLGHDTFILQFLILPMLFSVLFLQIYSDIFYTVIFVRNKWLVFFSFSSGNIASPAQ